MPINTYSKIIKKRICWLFIMNHSYRKKELDWHWTRETFSLCVRSFEESNTSSSSFSASTSRRGWSGSFLQKQFPQSIHWSDDRWKTCLAAGSVLMIQEQFFISKLFKDIQDAILLILHDKTVLLLRATSSNTCTILDKCSICILLSALN